MIRRLRRRHLWTWLILAWALPLALAWILLHRPPLPVSPDPSGPGPASFEEPSP